MKDEQDSSKRLLLLAQEISDAQKLPEDCMKVIEEFNVEVVPHVVQIGFDQCNTHEVLTKLLPEGMEIPSSFEAVGHIAHVNLRDEHEPFKNLIGSVILEKNAHIRTVVNKVGSIESTFRFFHMEVIAGEDKTEVEVQEEGCTFRFDYAKVYWNSRLQFEHRRLIEMIKPKSFICDMFCGVGPFTLPAAKRGCTVFANDLNPESIKWLQVNMVRNRIDKRVKAYNLDAREFVERALSHLSKEFSRGFFDDFIMNLPASAHEFLDVFPRLAQDGLLTLDAIENSTIHCYVFSRTGEDPIEKIEAGLGYPIDRDLAQVRRVRDVAPNKEMFCISFKLPMSIMMQSPKETISKKPRIE